MKYGERQEPPFLYKELYRLHLMITVLEKMECNQVTGKALDTGVDLLTVDRCGVDTSSVETSFMMLIRNFCKDRNPGAGSGGTKRKSSTSLTPVTKKISNSLGSNLDTPEQTANPVTAAPNTPASELQSPPGLLKNLKKGVNNIIAGFEKGRCVSIQSENTTIYWLVIG